MEDAPPSPMAPAINDEETASPPERVQKTIAVYLSERVPEFRRLSELRQQGWNNPNGDAFFQRQRHSADAADDRTAAYFYKLMLSIAAELQDATQAFTIHHEHAYSADTSWESSPDDDNNNNTNTNNNNDNDESSYHLSESKDPPPRFDALDTTLYFETSSVDTCSSDTLSFDTLSLDKYENSTDAGHESSPDKDPPPHRRHNKPARLAPLDTSCARRLSRRDRHADTHASLLDLCMAPGAFLVTALSHNPGARALAFSLPPDLGGHKMLLPQALTFGPNPTVQHHLIDITLLAHDLAYSKPIPASHPDAPFLPRHMPVHAPFSLVICDGQVLRTHHRAPYRLLREPRRLACAQLALALAHTRPGGSILCLLHKPESWHNILLLRTFAAFANLRLYKPRAGHAKRSSFYMLASNIQNEHPVAKAAVATWRHSWAVATFGTDEEYWNDVNSVSQDVNAVLEEFGPTLIALATSVWRVQADALAKAPFIRDARAPSGPTFSWTA